jgi:hypothetical protein
VLACGAFVDRRYLDNQKEALEKLELALFDVATTMPPMMPTSRGAAGFTCTVVPENFGNTKGLSRFAEKLDATLPKCIQDAFMAAPKETWGQGVVQVKLTKSGKLVYIEHLGEPSSKHINKAIACAKRKLGKKHSLQVTSNDNVYVLHRWSFVPYRGIFQNNANATPGSKTLRDQAGASKATPKGESIRELSYQTLLNRLSISPRISYSQTPTKKAKRLVESEVRETAGCVVREFLQRHTAGAVEFKFMFTADADGLATSPTLVSMHPKDEELYSCVGAGVTKLDMAKGVFGELTTVTADVRVTFE